MQTNEKGQVVTKTALLKQMEELIEEPGLTCCICREGYKFQVRCQTHWGLTAEDQPSSSEAGGRLIWTVLSSSCRSLSPALCQALCSEPLCPLGHFIFKCVMKSSHLWMRKQYP